MAIAQATPLKELSAFGHFSKALTQQVPSTFKITDIAAIRLVPIADKTTITMNSQINDYNETLNIYISSENLMMFAQRNRCDNRYTKLI